MKYLIVAGIWAILMVLALIGWHGLIKRSNQLLYHIQEGEEICTTTPNVKE